MIGLAFLFQAIEMEKQVKKQRGYTVIELLFGLIFLLALVLGGFGVYVIIHFISKFW